MGVTHCRGHLLAPSSRLAHGIALVLGIGAATPAMAACDVTTLTDVSAGSYSSAALQSNIDATRTDGSFSCTTAPLAILLASDYLRATPTSGSVLTLTGPGGGVSFTLSADAAGVKPLRPGVTTSYQEGTLLTLLDNSAMRPPIFVRPRSAGPLPPGNYSTTITIRWDWSFCTVAATLGICPLGRVDRGSKDARIRITLIVAPRPAEVVLAYTTTWSPTSSTSNPKAVPGAKVRIIATITNPDTVALDANTVAVMLATPATVRLVLEGDGTAANGSVESHQGAKASGLTLTYESSASITDDVDFSADGGRTWGYVPVLGDAASEATVTTVRFRPRGAMAAGSSFAVSLPYVVK